MRNYKSIVLGMVISVSMSVAAAGYAFAHNYAIVGSGAANYLQTHQNAVLAAESAGQAQADCRPSCKAGQAGNGLRLYG